PLSLIVMQLTAAPRRNLPDLADAKVPHALAPQIHGGAAHAKPGGDLLVLLSRQGHQNDPTPERYLLRGPLGRFPPFEFRSVCWVEPDFKACLTHGGRALPLLAIRKVICETLH